MTLIGRGAQWIGREPLGVASLWDLPCFPGVEGNKLLWP
jgi:hypothetical protein